jgi:hypothetical protein
MTIQDSTRVHTARAFIGRGALALFGGLLLSACTVQPGPGESEEAVLVSEGALGTCGVQIDPLKSIEIVHPNVVGDARASNVTGGPWSFRTLITNMARTSGTADVDAFLRGIFESWLSDQIVNGELVPQRPGADPSLLSLFTVPGSSPRQFDLTKAPFELIAIANRLDLRSPTIAGEGRFVFGLKFPSGGSGKGFFGSMTLIMEYALPLKAPLDTPAKWAAKWHELDTLDPVGAPAAFNAKLQEITDMFSVRNAFVGRPNGSAIDQIRSNEIQLGSPWQLREFNMNAAGQMLPATTKNSPNRAAIDNSQVLLDFVSQTPALGSNDTSFMSLNFPSNFGGNLFLGGRADEDFSDRWLLPNGETQTNSVRVDNLGQLTCNGCHNENKAPGDIAFYQVSPTNSTFNPNTGLNDGTGRLSQFMLVGDPTKGARRPAELNRRADDMATLLCAPNAVDLVVSSVKWTPANVLSGQSATFSAVVTNNGKVSKPAGAIIGVAFRVDGNLTSWSDTNTQALAPGQSVTLSANSGPSGSATWSATSGRHTLEAWVDDVNRIAEGDENNNKLTTPMVIGINLTIRNISWLPSTPQTGSAVRFSATVSNEGNIPTPAGVIVGVAFNVDGALTNWSDTNTASLAAGQTVTVTANSGPSGSGTWTATSGSHRVQAWADDVNRLVDVDRSDNKQQTLLAVP